MQKSEIRLALVFKDFAAWIRSSCVGLNVAGYTTAHVLREEGVDVSVFPVRHNVDLVHAIDTYNETHGDPLTHVVISAPWLSVYDLKSLLYAYPKIQFVILSHSNVGFLQADPRGVELMRHYLRLAGAFVNLRVGGNSARFVHWLREAYSEPYGARPVLLPNLYPAKWVRSKRPPLRGHRVHIGAFGAVRPEKNFMTAAAAAIVIQKKLGVPVELHMSTGGEGNRSMVLPAIEQMCADIPGLTLVRHEWRFWDKFIEIIGEMDVLLQPSYTESFNMITADGISMGVPSVVSSAISWAPDSWKADTDDAVDVAERGIELLYDPGARAAGVKALRKHNAFGLAHWFEFLECERPRAGLLDRIKARF